MEFETEGVPKVFTPEEDMAMWRFAMEHHPGYDRHELWKLFVEKTGSKRDPAAFHDRFWNHLIPHLKEIHLHTETKLKMCIQHKIPVGDEFLEALREDAVVTVTPEGEIEKYTMKLNVRPNVDTELDDTAVLEVTTIEEPAPFTAKDDASISQNLSQLKIKDSNEYYSSYGDYNSMSHVFEKYLKNDDKILMLGGGKLASQLFENGFPNIQSKEDATSLKSANVVIDQGNLDALLPPNASEIDKTRVTKMFDEVHRVLASGGRYIIVTLAQPHITEFWVDHFQPLKQYVLGVQKVDFRMPVFIFLAHKMEKPMPSLLPVYMVYTSTKPEKIEKLEQLKDAIRREQVEAHFLCLCSGKLEANASIDFYGDDQRLSPRYRISVVDTQRAKLISTFLVLVVSTARSREWRYRTPQGHRKLRKEWQTDRLVLVFERPNQNYENGLDGVKAEIGTFIRRLDTRVGDSGIYDIRMIEAKEIKVNGRSEINGKWKIEHETTNENIIKRLVFWDICETDRQLYEDVHCEAYLKTGKSNKLLIDKKNLAYYVDCMQIASLSLSDKLLLTRTDVRCEIAIVGMGGGLLAAYILHHFKRARLTVVELDPDVVDIAIKHFSFPKNDTRVKILKLKALEFLKKAAAKPEDEKYDVLFVDVSIRKNAILHCPPKDFLTEEVLVKMKNSLKEKGMLSLVAKGAEAPKNIANVFSRLYKFQSCEGVKEVIIGKKTERAAFELTMPQKLINAVCEDLGSYDDIVDAISRIESIDF